MISAWKKLLSKSPIDGLNASDHGTGQAGSNTMPPGIHKLDKDLQRKFARGVDYNMKVIIKGDNRVGKTSLFLRLKGYGFQEEYTPTESLSVTSIDWSYKTSDAVVKIDLWEAIDSASRKSVNFVDLKLENESSGDSSLNDKTDGHSTTTSSENNSTAKTKVTITSTKLQPNGSTHNNNNLPENPIPESARRSLADLSVSLDVYRGCNAVLLVMDMTKSWTFKYIQNELPKIPKHIPILVIGNHRDQGHHRSVSSEQVKAFIELQPREPCDGLIMYTEASMKNGFGLKLIEKFFNIPFLKLQEASLLKRLELNRHDYLATREELHLMEESTHKEYEQYLELQTIKRRQIADAMSPVNSGLRQLNENAREQIRNTSISSDMIDNRTSNAKSIESCNNQRSSASQNHHQAFVNNRLPSIVIGAKCPLPENSSIKLSAGQSLTSSSNEPNQVSQDESNSKADEKDEDDSEEEEEVRANPLVADYQSDIDSDDQLNKS